MAQYTEKVLSEIAWADTSDFKDIVKGEESKEKSSKAKKGKEMNRGVQNAIKFYDKVLDASMVVLLSKAKVSFPKGLLDKTTSMIKLMEKAFAAPTSGLQPQTSGFQPAKPRASLSLSMFLSLFLFPFLLFPSPFPYPFPLLPFPFPFPLPFPFLLMIF